MNYCPHCGAYINKMDSTKTLESLHTIYPYPTYPTGSALLVAVVAKESQ